LENFQFGYRVSGTKKGRVSGIGFRAATLNDTITPKKTPKVSMQTTPNPNFSTPKERPSLS